MDRESALARADEAARLGDTAKAIRILRETVRAEPESEEARRALARSYRQAGHPDQAGRWGLTIPGWTTVQERDAFAGSLLDARSGQERRLRELTLIPTPQELSADARDVLARAKDPMRGRRGWSPVMQAMPGRAGRLLEGMRSTGWLIGLVAVLVLVVGIPTLVIATLVAGDDVRPRVFGGLAAVAAMIGLGFLLTVPASIAVRLVSRRNALGE